jgi:hypothetical protein
MGLRHPQDSADLRVFLDFEIPSLLSRRAAGQRLGHGPTLVCGESGPRLIKTVISVENEPRNPAF